MPRYLSPAALSLVQSLLEYNPAKRITAADALETPFFTVEQPEKELPEYVFSLFIDCVLSTDGHVSLECLDGEWHEYESKRERERTKRKEKRKSEAGAHQPSATAAPNESEKPARSMDIP